jgi:hypothetical protein
MAIPTEQVDPFTRIIASKRKRRPKRKARGRQIGTKPPSTGGPPPKTIFGRPKPPSPPPQRRALDYEGLRQKGIRYHSNHLRRLWKNNKFPKPFKPSPRRLAWWEHDIDAWLEEKASASETNNAELPAEQKAVAVAGSEVDLHAAMRALERRCRALELELQKAKKPKPAAKREAT